MSIPGDSLSKVTSNISPTLPFYAASDTGFANSDGIIFSSINTNTPGALLKPISNPISAFVFSNPFQTQISKPFDISESSSNSDHVINSNINYLHPINIPVAKLQTNPVKSQETYASAGFTFAPLVATISLPMLPLQTDNLTTQQNHLDNQVFAPQPKPPPTTTPPPPLTTPKLPSANEDLTNSVTHVNKCGITKYTNLRVVGGAVTQIGQQLIFFFFSKNETVNEW